jgi:hypothetical protein
MTSSEQNDDCAHQCDRVTALLSEPLLLPGEDRAVYEALLASAVATVQPSDILEQIWTHEAVEKQWEALRQRCFKTALIAASRQKALAAVLDPLMSDPLAQIMGDHDTQMLAWKFTLGHKDAIKEVEALLRKANLPAETVHAQAMALDINTFEKFDHLIWAAESRRDACLREIEYHRALFGQKLWRVIAHVDNAEIRQIESPTEQKRAA